MPRISLPCSLSSSPLGQQLADDGGGGHGQGPAQGQAGLPGKLQHQAQDHDDEHGDRHLQAAQAEYRLAHGLQAGEGKLQADGEHQEHHAELRQVAGGRFRIDTRQEGTEADADQHVAQQGGQSRRLQRGHREHAGGKQDQGQFQGRGHHAVRRSSKRRGVTPDP
jgi:hypothetical protein